MSFNQYSITLKNHFSSTLAFSLFLDVPQSTNGPPPDKVFRSIYATSTVVPSGEDSQFIFTMQSEFFAVCGTTLMPLGVKTRPQT